MSWYIHDQRINCDSTVRGAQRGGRGEGGSCQTTAQTKCGQAKQRHRGYAANVLDNMCELGVPFKLGHGMLIGFMMSSELTCLRAKFTIDIALSI